MSTNDFFANFPKFTHDPSAPISKEFSRLANQRQWRKKSKTWKKQWNRCMNSEYERQIGSTLTGLEAWVALCNEMGLDGPFMSIRQCKKALSRVYVNLVDLLDSRRDGSTVRKFPNLRALREYTRKTGKIFSRELAKQDGFLRVFLKRLL